MSGISKRKEILLLLIILAIASFFRLWQLAQIPPGLYPDVAINGNDALETLKTGDFKVFYPENNGREGLMLWLIALSFSIFGASVWSIKIVAAIIGILTVLGLYLLTKELFNKTSIAFLSSFFLAVSFWHTNFSRIGFRAILVPFVLVFAFYFLFRGLRAKKLSNFVISGLFFGLGFYTYISFRLAILILPAVLIPFWLIYKKVNIQKQFLLFSFYFLVSIFIVILPIAFYFLQNPQDFTGRAAQASIFSQEEPLKALGESLVKHLAMFNFYGDPNWRHNFSGSPMLPWPVGILFLIGIALAIKNLIHSLKEKNCLGFTVYCLLFSWFFAMLLPGILTSEGIPHGLRVIGVIPIVYIFAALGAWFLYEKFNQIFKNERLFAFVCLLLIVCIGYSEFNKYFFLWAKNPNVEGAFTKKFSDIGDELNSLPPETAKYVIVNEPGVSVPFPNGIPMPAQTPLFIESAKYGSPSQIFQRKTWEGKPRSTYLIPGDLDKIKIDKETVIVPMKYDEGLFNEISRRFPQGEIKEKDEIWIYLIKTYRNW